MRKKDRLTEYCYDSLGRQTQIKEWYGHEPGDYRNSFKDFDYLNRIVREWVESSDGTLLVDSEFRYDCLGNKIFVRDGQNITLTDYDTHGNPVKIVNALGHTTISTFNTNFINKYGHRVLQSETVETTDPKSCITIHTYDNANRLVDIARKNSLGEIIASQQFYYDLYGNKIQIVDHAIANGEKIRKTKTVMTYTADNQIEMLIEGKGLKNAKMTQFKYNDHRQKISKVKPDGTSINFTYDTLGRLQTIKSTDESIDYTFFYNRNDELEYVKDHKHHMDTERKYNRFGELKSETLEKRDLSQVSI